LHKVKKKKKKKKKEEGKQNAKKEKRGDKSAKIKKGRQSPTGEEKTSSQLTRLGGKFVALVSEGDGLLTIKKKHKLENVQTKKKRV